jgi:hypothetical protein
MRAPLSITDASHAQACVVSPKLLAERVGFEPTVPF